MKILLIHGNELSQPSVHRKKFENKSPVYPPLGLLYIAKSLENEGHKVEIIDYFVEQNTNEKIKKRINTSDAIGMTIDNDSFNESAKVAQSIKETDPSIPILIGGPHCTLYPDQALKNIQNADISVCGDGEHVVKDIAKSLQGKKKLKDIAGIHYKKGKNRIYSGKPPQNIEDLDTIPFPSRHLVEKYDYGKMEGEFFFKPPLTSIVTTRGCPFHCKYCIRHIIQYKKYRQRSAVNILNELKEINGKYTSLMIADDTFLADKKRAHLIMDGIIENDISLNLLIGGTRADIYDRDLFKKMKKAGVTYISYGIESGNQLILDYYKKRLKLEQIKKSVQLSNEMGFVINASFIFGAPMETLDHIENTIKFACSLPLDTVAFYPLSYRHGSDLWKEAVQNGFLQEHEHEVIADKKYNLTEFTKEEILKYCTIGMKMFYYRPKYAYQQVKKAIKNDNPTILRIGMKSLIKPYF